MRYYSIGQVAKLLGVSVDRVRAWEKQGKIRCIRLPSGHRRYPEEEVRRILGQPSVTEGGGRVAVYARVSTRKQAEAGNLQRQKERLLAHAALKGYRVVHVFDDVASGLNPNRRGLKRLVKALENREIDRVLIEYPDRLARFGFEYLEWITRMCGASIEIVAEKEPEDMHNELVRDLLAIVTSFSARLYGAPGGRAVRKRFREWMKDAEAEARGHESHDLRGVVPGDRGTPPV
ncbi:IS607 family transposase [Kyrpidia tusciae]|uniref:DNA binding domain protein, excisionase family n=1 Tax=Kyrpidia tusciae (strain DSM 2912 / NBRC 15312 / T2) TaxID=562970 RepID=D5WSG7_KYRT2|nr:IS607 family transposase [Kyrpidia tusciae]ADG05052.1 DNA binding domain protein, excisionase family [Kyrpidia tusciae DSM 2912]